MKLFLFLILLLHFHRLTLPLKPIDQTTIEIIKQDTLDTFHTANSDCSVPTSPENHFNLHPSSCNPDRAMSDSGVCLESQRTNPLSTRHDSTSKSTDDDDESSCFSCDASRGIPLYAEVKMNKLREKIAILKAHIMKNLENGSSKDELNGQIEELQELRKAFLKLEMEYLNNKESNGKYY